MIDFSRGERGRWMKRKWKGGKWMDEDQIPKVWGFSLLLLLSFLLASSTSENDDEELLAFVLLRQALPPGLSLLLMNGLLFPLASRARCTNDGLQWLARRREAEVLHSRLRN
jgi:hypothetical protein